MDSGIIQNFEVKYCKMLLEFLLSHEDVTALTDTIKKVNVGDAVDRVFQSWDQVVASTIKNCFRKASLTKMQQNQNKMTDRFKIKKRCSILLE